MKTENTCKADSLFSFETCIDYIHVYFLAFCFFFFAFVGALFCLFAHCCHARTGKQTKLITPLLHSATSGQNLRKGPLSVCNQKRGFFFVDVGQNAKYNRILASSVESRSSDKWKRTNTYFRPFKCSTCTIWTLVYKEEGVFFQPFNVSYKKSQLMLCR